MRAQAVVAEDGGTIRVAVEWRGVAIDRLVSYTWVFSTSQRKLVGRLVRCINAQAATPRPRVLTDKLGQTYVDHDLVVIGRRAGADLRRLGF